jgi:hypothetical protein
MVDNHKESDGPVPSSVTAGAPAPAVASTSNGLSIRFPEPAASSLHLSSSNPDIGSSRYQLRSTSRTRGSKCRSRPTLSLGTTPLLGALGDEDGEHDRNFEMMPAPSNAALHRYFRNLARVRMDLAARLVARMGAVSRRLYSWSCVSKRNRKRRRTGLGGCVRLRAR